MNSISAWFAIPLSLAVLGVVMIIMRCLRRKHVNLTLEGLGVKISINIISKVNHENDFKTDHSDATAVDQGHSSALVVSYASGIPHLPFDVVR